MVHPPYRNSDLAQRLGLPQIEVVLAQLGVDRDLLVGRDVGNVVSDRNDARAG